MLNQPQSTEPNAALPRPFIHTTPSEAVEKITSDVITLGDRRFQIAYPGNADNLLDHPSTHAAFGADEYMPYWAQLWPAAQMLAEVLLTEDFSALRQAPNAQITALEIGCGVGLPGIAALSRGLRVIFSDYDATAVEFAARNAIANGFDNFEILPLDWRFPPSFRVPLILAADVIYEIRNIAPLVRFMQTVLAPNGLCLLSDPDRATQGHFKQALWQAGFAYDEQPMAMIDGGRQVSGTLFRIRTAP